MPLLFLDFETFSYADLPEIGAYRYAEHPSTEVLCVAWALDDGPVELIVGEDLPHDIPEDVIQVAHNIEFEREIMRHRFGIETAPEEWIDTAALSARMGLPRNLEEASEFFGLDTAEKMQANTGRLGDSVCRPRPPTKGNPDTRWTPATKPEAFAALYRRCKRDVELSRELLRRLLPLDEQERKTWLLTMKMNERGVKIDLPSIPPARAVIEKESAPMIAEFTALTGCKLKSYVRVARWCGLPDVRKPTVRKALRKPGLDPRVHRALSIYQALSKSSIGKLDAMEARAHADSRVRGSFLYCGAERTSRWSSSGLQLQNFKRGLSGETNVAFAALHAGSLEFVFDGAPRPSPDPVLTPTGTVAEMLRGFVIGPFLVGDLAQIEARGIAWLAEDEDQLKLFRNKGDPYCAMASVIYGVPVTKKEKDRRFMGKQAELGCGYGLGGGGFQFMLDDIYDVQIEDEFARLVTNAYRQRHPKIVAFWKRLNDGFIHALAKKAESLRVTRNISMGYKEINGTPFLWIELPSGRRMYYGAPELVTTPKGPAVSYYGRDRFSGGWSRVRTYGGKLAENVTQAVSRDVIAQAMLRLDAAGFDLVMTVHDEVVAEAGRSLEEFKSIIEIVPPWAAGLPIEVDAFETERYRK
jgi:DNA polymerase